MNYLGKFYLFTATDMTQCSYVMHNFFACCLRYSTQNEFSMSESACFKKWKASSRGFISGFLDLAKSKFARRFLFHKSVESSRSTMPVCRRPQAFWNAGHILPTDIPGVSGLQGRCLEFLVTNVQLLCWTAVFIGPPSVHSLWGSGR